MWRERELYIAISALMYRVVQVRRQVRLKHYKFSTSRSAKMSLGVLQDGTWTDDQTGSRFMRGDCETM